MIIINGEELEKGENVAAIVDEDGVVRAIIWTEGPDETLSIALTTQNGLKGVEITREREGQPIEKVFGSQGRVYMATRITQPK